MRKLYELGELQLDPEARVLTHGGDPVALGARGVAVLTALINRANEYVPKAEIMDAAWPGLVVEEANLAVQISAIRRALARVPGGEGWIETLARRGYRFVGPVAARAGGKSETPAPVDRMRSNLPLVHTSFVGREREIAEIKQLLATTRLLTLTGTGGIGKTRLALQAAAEMLDAYRDGIWFVHLAPLTDPALVSSALAQVLGVKEAAGQPLLKTVCEYLRAKELLLVLDNCEHLLGGSADLVDTLLRDTARVSVIGTSRESLRVATERTYPVNVLPLPDPKSDATTIARSEAVQLFVDRARQHRPRFDLEGPRARAVAEICVRLDGLPLALELAAARMAVLPVEEIVRLLDQRFRLLTRGGRGDLPRQQTLRAMIDWSHELLDAAVQQLFARLSVFAGGWTIAAAEVVGAGEAIAKDDVVYLLIALIEKSLVVADEDGDRYRMLETVREYAREKLAESGSAKAVRERHRDYFLALAEEAEPKLSGAEQAEWLPRLELEHDNLQSALEWSLVATGTVEGLRLCGALLQFWLTLGHLSEGREWCERILGKVGAEKPTPERAKALFVAGTLASYQGDNPSARVWNEKSLAVTQKLGDQRGIASALNNLGNVACDEGDYIVAGARYEESLAIRRELDDQGGVASSLICLGNLTYEQGNYGEALVLFDRSLAIWRQLGDRKRIASALLNLGIANYQQGNHSTARELYDESLTDFRELGDRGGIASSLNVLGSMNYDFGDFASAQRLLAECVAIQRVLGDQRGIANALHDLGNVAYEQGDYLAGLTLHREGLVLWRAQGARPGMAHSLEGLGAVVSALGSPSTALRILGAAERLRAEIGSPLHANEQRQYDQRVAAVRAALGDDAAFDQAWQEGRAMPLEQAIKLALEEPVVQR